jgi:hypothetical protein
MMLRSARFCLSENGQPFVGGGGTMDTSCPALHAPDPSPLIHRPGRIQPGCPVRRTAEPGGGTAGRRARAGRGAGRDRRARRDADSTVPAAVDPAGAGGGSPVVSVLAAAAMVATLFLPSGVLAAGAFFLFGAGPIVWTITTTTLRQSVTPGTRKVFAQQRAAAVDAALGRFARDAQSLRHLTDGQLLHVSQQDHFTAAVQCAAVKQGGAVRPKGFKPSDERSFPLRPPRARTAWGRRRTAPARSARLPSAGTPAPRSGRCCRPSTRTRRSSGSRHGRRR